MIATHEEMFPAQLIFMFSPVVLLSSHMDDADINAFQKLYQTSSQNSPPIRLVTVSACVRILIFAPGYATRLVRGISQTGREPTFRSQCLITEVTWNVGYAFD